MAAFVTIPSVLAYGETDNGTIPANSSLKFVVMLIPKTPQPDMSDELQAEYNALLGYPTEAETSEGETQETTE